MRTLDRPIPSYASRTSIDFDEARGVYVGQVMSKNGIHLLEAPDRLTLEYEVEGLLRSEYNKMIRDEAIRKRARDKDLSEKESEKNSHSNSVSRHEQKDHVEGIKIHRHKPGEFSSKPKTATWVDMITGGLALSHGNYFEAAMSAASAAFGEWFERVESIWDRNPKPKVFAVMFDGILIKASSMAMLKKLLVRQRNKRIQRIMIAIRQHEEERGISSVEGITGVSAQRLRAKKKRAQLTWKTRVCPEQTELVERTLDLRERVKTKKELANLRWIERV